MKKTPWSRNDKIGLTSLAVAIVACGVAFVIPEGRRLVGLDKPVSLQGSTRSVPAVAPSQAVQSPAPIQPKSQTPQRTTTKVKGNKNVTGNNVAGNGNVVGNNNKVNAPNGPTVTQGPGSAFSMNQTGGITAGTINVDTGRRLSESEIAAIRASTDGCASLPFVNVTASNGNQEAQRYASDIIGALRGAGCKVDLALPTPGLEPDVIGVLIGVRDYNDPGVFANVLRRILSRARISSSFVPMKADFFPDEAFVLVIGAKE